MLIVVIDSSLIVNEFEKTTKPNTYFETLVKDIRDKNLRFQEFKFQQIHRSINQAAHALAQYARTIEFDVILVVNWPNEAIFYAIKDQGCMLCFLSLIKFFFYFLFLKKPLDNKLEICYTKCYTKIH